jgi:hypothetical protein
LHEALTGANYANQRFAENNAHRQDVTDTKFCISREFLFCKISDPDKYKPKVTTHVVRLKLFRLKAEGVRRARLPYFGGNI